MNPNTRVSTCRCCGGTDIVDQKVLWPDLINTWGLSPQEVGYVDRQQGTQCAACGATLRSMALANAIMSHLGFAGLFCEFVTKWRFRNLRVLEINRAGQLTAFFKKMRRHRLMSYPALDMQQMTLPDQSFDLIVHSDTLEHIPNPVQGLRECHRVLAPGGACAFTIPIIVGRMTRSTAGSPKSYHGLEADSKEDYAVQTEYGADAWRHAIEAGFPVCELHAMEYPAAMALVARG